MAAKKDPTISTASLDPKDSEAPSAEAATRAPENAGMHYEDNPDKPDPDSVAQIQVIEEP